MDYESDIFNVTSGLTLNCNEAFKNTTDLPNYLPPGLKEDENMREVEVFATLIITVLTGTILFFIVNDLIDHYKSVFFKDKKPNEFSV